MSFGFEISLFVSFLLDSLVVSLSVFDCVLGGFMLGCRQGDGF